MELARIVVGLGLLELLANRVNSDSLGRRSDKERLTAQGFGWGGKTAPHAAARHVATTLVHSARLVGCRTRTGGYSRLGQAGGAARDGVGSVWQPCSGERSAVCSCRAVRVVVGAGYLSRQMATAQHPPARGAR
jgi:hypothetical protein